VSRRRGKKGLISMRRIFGLLPFILLCILILVCFYKIFSGGFIPTPKHILALVATIINGAVYVWRFRFGVVLTMLVLLLASFSAISISFLSESTSFFIRSDKTELETPNVNYFSLGLLSLHLIVNFRLIRDSYNRFIAD
jgi:hypothetical protein